MDIKKEPDDRLLTFTTVEITYDGANQSDVKNEVPDEVHSKADRFGVHVKKEIVEDDYSYNENEEFALPLKPEFDCESNNYKKESFENDIKSEYVGECSQTRNELSIEQLPETILQINTNTHTQFNVSQTNRTTNDIQIDEIDIKKEILDEQKVAIIVLEKSLIFTKNFVCNYCHKTFPTPYLLKRHRALHSGEKIFECLDCAFKCLRYDGLQKHRRTHAGEKPFKCNDCDYRCGLLGTMNTHRLKHNGKKPFECDLCGYKCGLANQLKKHKLIHTDFKPFECGRCTYKCGRLSTLRIHVMTHTGEKPHSCDQCNYRCVQSQALKTHKRSHTGLKPFACDLCDRKYTQISRLKEHKLAHELNTLKIPTNAVEKPLKCDVCSYTCVQTCHLKAHKLTHTGAKPFGCDECGYRCGRPDHLKVHKMIHSGVKPFGCDLCEYKCSQVASLRRHKKTHTRKKTCLNTGV